MTGDQATTSADAELDAQRWYLWSGTRFLSQYWSLTQPFWFSAQARYAVPLLITAIALEFGTVYGNVLIAGAQRKAFDALQAKDAAVFFGTVSLFVTLIVLFALVAAYRMYFRQWLEMRWRNWLTRRFLDRWVGGAAVHASVPSGAVDNPDQRIAEDIRNFVASALGLSLSLLSAAATLFSFAGMLWVLSGTWPITIGERTFQVPGLMMWVAIVYSVIAMSVTHWIGRPLMHLNFERLRVEADFRYSLVRFRDNVDAVALATGEEFEKRETTARFGRIVMNWWKLIAAQRHLMVLTTGIGQSSSIVPLLVASPLYFNGQLTLGSLTMVGIAYGQVTGALTWFVNAYQEIAQWRASIERLCSFRAAMRTSKEILDTTGVVYEQAEGTTIRLEGLSLAVPDGRVLLADVDAVVEQGHRVAIMGPSGTGRSLLLRAIAGVWNYGSGRVIVPSGARILFLTLRPYMPIGTLRQAVCYPSDAEQFTELQVAEALSDLGLTRLIPRLEETAPWDMELSGDEQQRVAFARVLLQQPRWLCIDDAAAQIEEGVMHGIYDLLARRLPDATILSITSRESVAQCHDIRWIVTRGSDGTAVLTVQA